LNVFHHTAKLKKIVIVVKKEFESFVFKYSSAYQSVGPKK